MPLERQNGGGDRKHDDFLDPRELLDALQAVRMGDFSVRLPAT